MVQFILVKHPSHPILYLLKHKKDFNIYVLFSNSYHIVVVDILYLMYLFEMVILTFVVFCFLCSDLKLYKTVNTFPFILYNKKWSKIKTINNELLIYLDEIALAYWAMDEGAWTKSGFIYIQKDLHF